MNEEKYKLAPGVLCCPSKFGVIHEREKEYSIEQWNEDDAERYVKDGFLVKTKERKERKELK